MIASGLITIASAFVIHFTRFYMNRINGEGWRFMSKCTIGVTFTFPFSLHFFEMFIKRLTPELLPFIETLKVIFTIAYFIAFLFFGMGVALGYLFEFFSGMGGEE